MLDALIGWTRARISWNNSEYMHVFPLRVMREAGLAIFPKSRISFNNNHDFSVLV